MWDGLAVTCIVGVQAGDAVVMGGDSAAVGGYVRTHRADPKVFDNGGYLVGFTSSFRMGQILRFADLPDPELRTGDRLDQFMMTVFVDAVRSSLADAGYATKDKDREAGGTFLVGVHGRLYRVGDDYQVGWSRDGYEAVGAGWELAYGALFATRRSTSPEARARRALEAAAHHSTVVHPPFTILSRTWVTG